MVDFISAHSLAFTISFLIIALLMGWGAITHLFNKYGRATEIEDLAESYEKGEIDNWQAASRYNELMLKKRK